ncbi:MAG: aspartyl protease family protein [Chloroflexota bacterium]|nr:aspartyl protease family protein [Chloroflexota bacterium]
MKLDTYSYSADYAPSMPVVDVTLVAPHSGEEIGPELALVDSGADGTLIPVDLLEQIGLVSIATGRLIWLWRESLPVSIYIVRIKIGPYVLPRVHVAGVPTGTDLVLGRNVLNQMVVTLNGPAEVTEIPA